MGRVYVEWQSGTGGTSREEARWDLPAVGPYPTSPTVQRVITHPGGDLRMVSGYRRDSGTFAVPVANTISTTTFDIISGAGAGDRIDLTDAARTVATATDLTAVALADNKATFVRGTYDATANTFVGSATGADTLLVYDADAAATTAHQSVVLTGFVNTATAAAGADGIFTLA